jgi:hypothetical protein
MTFPTRWPVRASALAFVFLASVSPVTAQTPQAQQTPMNMAAMDHRGGVRGTVRGANKAPVPDTAVRR